MVVVGLSDYHACEREAVIDSCFHWVQASLSWIRPIMSVCSVKHRSTGPNQINASRIREIPDERKSSKILPPFIRGRKAPGIGCQKNPSQGNSRFRLQEKFTVFLRPRYIKLRSGKVVGSREAKVLFYQRENDVRLLSILRRDPTSANR